MEKRKALLGLILIVGVLYITGFSNYKLKHHSKDNTGISLTTPTSQIGYGVYKLMGSDPESRDSYQTTGMGVGMTGGAALGFYGAGGAAAAASGASWGVRLGAVGGGILGAAIGAGIGAL